MRNYCFNIIQNRINNEIILRNANMVLDEQHQLQEPTYVIPYFFILLCGIIEMCIRKVTTNGRTM